MATGDVDVTVSLDMAAINAVLRDPGLGDVLLNAARPTLVATARSLAPRRTGAGAASIRAEATLMADGWEVRVSWDDAHKYMRFQDKGTKYVPAKHFLEQAAATYAV